MRPTPRVLLAVLSVCTVGAGCWAAEAPAPQLVAPTVVDADWPEWRGPGRAGAAGAGPALPAAWPEAGLPMLWSSEKIPTYNEGGLGSVVVVAGRAFVYANWKYRDPIETRTLGDGELRRLGWNPEMPAPELLAAAEAARLSEARAALPKNEVGKWAEAWLAEHVQEEETKKKFGGWLLERLRRGADALAPTTLTQLAEIKGKTFATAAELDAWFAAAGIEGKLRDEVLKVVPTTRECANDVVLCFAADSGDVLWRASFPGEPRGWDNSGTPCVQDGRLYILASGGKLLCLSTADGSVLWQAQAGAGAGSSSAAVRDGKLFLVAGHLAAHDADTGEGLWKQPAVRHSHASPQFWTHAGETFLLCNSGNELVCLNPADGAVLWKVSPGGNNSTPAVAGDIAVVQGEGSGLTAYRLSREGAETLWHLPHNDRGSTPVIRDGHVYVVSGGGQAKAMCIALESGQVLWEEKVPGQEISSPILAGDRLLAFVGNARELWLIEAVPTGFNRLAKAVVHGANCSTPTLVGGRLFLRTNEGVACFDALATPPPPAPAPAAP
jgi:outer membrane protein assembly factor BamB